MSGRQLFKNLCCISLNMFLCISMRPIYLSIFLFALHFIAHVCWIYCCICCYRAPLLLIDIFRFY